MSARLKSGMSTEWDSQRLTEHLFPCLQASQDLATMLSADAAGDSTAPSGASQISAAVASVAAAPGGLPGPSPPAAEQVGGPSPTAVAAAPATKTPLQRLAEVRDRKVACADARGRSCRRHSWKWR